MLRTFKTEIQPTKEQRIKINQTIGNWDTSTVENMSHMFNGYL